MPTCCWMAPTNCSNSSQLRQTQKFTRYHVTATTFDMSNTQKDGPLHSNKEMYLVIQYTDPNDSKNRSYRYFKVTIGDPQL